MSTEMEAPQAPPLPSWPMTRRQFFLQFGHQIAMFSCLYFLAAFKMSSLVRVVVAVAVAVVVSELMLMPECFPKKYLEPYDIKPLKPNNKITTVVLC